jgi:hypothetical protein
MDNNELDDFIKLFTTVAGYYGKDKTKESAMIYWNALKAYPFEFIKEIMNRHIQTSKFMPMVSEVLDILRIMDGRPEPQEAWSIVARSLSDESVTIVWTTEMALAFGVALGLSDDKVAARMAFLEAYKLEVSKARASGSAVKWEMSIGTDRYGRDGPLLEAVSKGRLPAAAVEPHLIGESAPQDLKRIANVRKVGNLLAGFVPRIDEKAPRSDSKAIANRTPSTSPQNRT